MTVEQARGGFSAARRDIAHRVRSALAYTLAWSPVALLYSALIYQQTSGRLSALQALRAGLDTVVLPALLGIGVWKLSALLRVPDTMMTLKLSGFVLMHTVFGLLFGSAWTAWQVALIGATGRQRIGSYVLWHNVIPWMTLLGFATYCVIAVLSYAARGVTRMRELQLTAERAERLRSQAELAVLRAHINPHFLFNSLHSVSQLLRSEPARAEEALERLSDLFRYVLHLDRYRVELVPLEDEWQFTKSYLWLEQMRMGDRLRVDAALDDDALMSAVPPFTLQPLVENAIRHGLAPKPGGGVLRIRAREADGVLLLSVSDDGVGANSTAAGDESGIGVRAVRQRLEARHGTASNTIVKTEPGAGYSVQLTFPAEYT